MFDQEGKYLASDIRSDPNINSRELEKVDLESSLPDTMGSDDPTCVVEQNTVMAETKRRTKPFVYLVAATAAFGSLLFGFSLTGAGGTFVMKGFKEQFQWSCPEDSVDCTPLSENQISSEESLVTALQSVGSIFGAVFNCLLLDRIGRKYTILTAALVFIIGATIQCTSSVIQMLYIGRLIGGFGIGMLAMSVPVYIGEISPSHKRGQLTTFWQVGVTVGMLIGTAVNLGVSGFKCGWRFSYGGPIIFAVVLALSMGTFMPESPRFLASRELSEQQREKLVEVLHKLRYEEDIEHSTEAIEEEVRLERELGVASWTEVFRKTEKLRYRLLLGVGMQFLNQLSGNETINFYAPKILSNVFSDSQSLLSSFLLGVVNLVAVTFALFTVDRFGRVPLWMMGGLVMLLAQIANSVLQSLESTNSINIAFLVGLSVFTFAYHGTMGPLAWDICSEMFPARERGKAVGLTTMSNFMGVVVVGAVFPYAMATSPAGCFAFFSVMLFSNMCFVYFFLPETAELSPLQIEEEFKQHHPKVMRNVLTKHHRE
jgi:sugar porter (SP) family MFS transporter